MAEQKIEDSLEVRVIKNRQEARCLKFDELGIGFHGLTYLSYHQPPGAPYQDLA